MSSHGEDWRPRAGLDALRQRAQLLACVRSFFSERKVLEVETPALSQAAGTEPHVAPVSCRLFSRTAYLNTSPEFAMKRLLAAFGQPLYQVCRVFREDQPGPLHNPEFSLLEWYRPGFDMMRLMDEMQALIDACQRALRPSASPSAYHRLSYRQAFADTLDLDPHRCSSADCWRLAQQQGIEIPQGMDAGSLLDDWLDWLMLAVVAPSFKSSDFTFLYDYPASQCSLARIAEDERGQPVARRFELYFGEIELANGFEELTDAAEQAARFAAENRRRQSAGLPQMPEDKRLLAALAAGMPECSGVALGLDRLLMVLAGCRSVDEVLAFPWARC